MYTSHFPCYEILIHIFEFSVQVFLKFHVILHGLGAELCKTDTYETCDLLQCAVVNILLHSLQMQIKYVGFNFIF
jgi:hypothetical protein